MIQKIVGFEVYFSRKFYKLACGHSVANINTRGTSSKTDAVWCDFCDMQQAGKRER